MPKGVEHYTGAVTAASGSVVFYPLMPKGVEHASRQDGSNGFCFSNFQIENETQAVLHKIIETIECLRRKKPSPPAPLPKGAGSKTELY